MGKNILYKTLETQETNGERRKRQMPQAKKFLHNPENNQQNEKTNYRVSDNIGTVIYISNREASFQTTTEFKHFNS